MNKIILLLNLLADKRFRTVSDLIKNKIYNLISLRKYLCHSFFSKEILEILKQPNQKIILIIDNNIGGGSRKYLDQFIDEYRTANKIVIRLYYEIRDRAYYFDILINKNQRSCIGITSVEEISRYFNLSSIETIFINQLVNFPKPYDVLSFIHRTKSKFRMNVKIAVHDYYLLCPSYNLINNEGVFCHIPDNLSRCDTCLQHPFYDIDVYKGEKNIRIWRQKWLNLLMIADTILVFSRSSKSLLLKVYSSIDHKKIQIVPHRLESISGISHQHNKDKHRSTEELVLGVLGNIIYIKGASIIKEMLELIENSRLNIRIVVIGEYDILYRHPSLTVTGRYKENELSSLVEKHHIDLFFVSSICPETFSYTTEEIFAMNYPVISFDLGAPAERISNYSQGHIIKTIDAHAVLSKLNQLKKESRIV